jgi:hypothetical protein
MIGVRTRMTSATFMTEPDAWPASFANTRSTTIAVVEGGLDASFAGNEWPAAIGVMVKCDGPTGGVKIVPDRSWRTETPQPPGPSAQASNATDRSPCGAGIGGIRPAGGFTAYTSILNCCGGNAFSRCTNCNRNLRVSAASEPAWLELSALDNRLGATDAEEVLVAPGYGWTGDTCGTCGVGGPGNAGTEVGLLRVLKAPSKAVLASSSGNPTKST